MTSAKRSQFDRAGSVRIRFLALLFIGALLLCHGVFGAVHLCPTPQASAKHVHAHPSSAQMEAPAHEHPLCHLVHAAEYFAVLLVALFGLILGQVLRGAW